MSARVWVDYNEIDEQQIASSHTNYVTGAVPGVGEPVMTFDGDGNTCPGVVTMSEDQLLCVQLDMALFTPGPVGQANA